MIISSATLDAEMFAEFFTEGKMKAQIISIEGRCYPVDIYYLNSPCPDYVTKAVETCRYIHSSQPAGEILVFLTGQEDIDLFCDMMGDEKDIQCLPLHSALNTEKQLEVFTPPPVGCRRVISSTNLAETSVTLEGVVYVVDSCFVKVKVYNAISGTESLNIVPVSKAQATQRAGRAGRVRPGKCFRLCTKEDYESLKERSPPEILRTDLSRVVIYLKSLGIDNIPDFPFITKPNENALIRAFEVLFSLGALDENASLTLNIGQPLAEFPIDPRYAVMLLNSGSEQFNCSEEILTIVSMLSIQKIFSAKTPEQIVYTKRRLGAKEGDHICLLNIFNRFVRVHGFQDRRKFCNDFKLNMRALQRAMQLRDQLKKLLYRYRVKLTSCEGDVESVLRCMTTGLFMNAAQREGMGTYRTLKGNQAYSLHPTSILHILNPPWILFTEILHQDKPYISDASEIDADWLAELAPQFYRDSRVIQLQIRHKKAITR